MVHAPDVAWLDAKLSADAALGQVVERPHSRYPVGDGSLDRLLGIVHVRELIAAARDTPSTPIGALVEPAPIVPENKHVGTLLRELRGQRRRLAGVVDEYGGTVSIEDILQRLVGAIEDEYDPPAATLTRLDEHHVRVAGSMSVDEFNEAVGAALPHGSVRTLAGLVLDTLGHRPQCDETVELGDVRITVEQLDNARITWLRVELPNGHD